MAEKEYFELALKYANLKGCSIVKPAGRKGKWHYFAFTRPDLPKYGSLPSALRIDSKGKVEELKSFIDRQNVNNWAYELSSCQELT